MQRSEYEMFPRHLCLASFRNDIRGNYTMGCPKFFAGFEYRAPLHYIQWDLVRRHFPSGRMRKGWKKWARARWKSESAVFFLEVRGRCHAGTPDDMTHRFHETLSLLFQYKHFDDVHISSGQTWRFINPDEPCFTVWRKLLLLHTRMFSFSFSVADRAEAGKGLKTPTKTAFFSCVTFWSLLFDTEDVWGIFSETDNIMNISSTSIRTRPSRSTQLAFMCPSVNKTHGRQSQTGWTSDYT